MRRSLLAAFTTIIVFMSCNQPENSSGNNQVQKNLAAGRTVSKAFETGDVTGIDSVVANDFVDHTDKGDKVGKDSLKAMINMMHTYFKDMKMETLREVADSEYVFQWMRYSGTSDGAMGMPAGPYDMHVIEVAKLKDGKIVEHWAYMDQAEMMKMMGGQAPANQAANDTSKAKQ